MKDLDRLTWPLLRLGELMEAMARVHGLPLRGRETPIPPRGLAGDGDEAFGPWIEAAAVWLGLEAEPVEAPYAEVVRLVRRAGPAILHMPGDGGPRFIALLGGPRRAVSVLGPDLTVHRLRLEALRVVLCQGVEAPLVAEVDLLLDEVGVPVWRRGRARAAILHERLGSTRIADGWLLQLPPGTRIWDHIRHARVWRRLFVLIGAHAVQYGVWLLSWWVVGQGALQGRLDHGWLVAWVLLLLTLIPLRMLVTWSQGQLAIGLGGLLKRWLLAGALRLEPEEIRHQGVGQLLGRVIESEVVESLALSGGVLGLVAGIELILAAMVLGAVAGGWLQVVLLSGWVACTGLLGWRYFGHRKRWTGMRLGLTHDLIERMVGHRTRLASPHVAPCRGVMPGISPLMWRRIFLCRDLTLATSPYPTADRLRLERRASARRPSPWQRVRPRIAWWPWLRWRSRADPLAARRVPAGERFT